MNNIDKKLISRIDLRCIIYDHFGSLLDHGFGYYDGIAEKTQDIRISISESMWERKHFGAELHGNHWVIYTGYDDSNVNIKVYRKSVKFNENSVFNDFDRDFMYELYLKIKEYVDKYCFNDRLNYTLQYLDSCMHDLNYTKNEKEILLVMHDLVEKIIEEVKRKDTNKEENDNG